MRFTGAKKAANPNAIVADILHPNRIQHIIQPIDNFIGENIFANFRTNSFFREIFC